MIAEGLKPITKVLLDVFPWLDPENPNECNVFNVFQDDNSVFQNNVSVLYPTQGTIIYANVENGKGQLRWGSLQMPSHGIKPFIPGDLADAVGIVSATLPEWLGWSEFQKPVFHRYFRIGQIRPTSVWVASHSQKMGRLYTLKDNGSFTPNEPWRKFEDSKTWIATSDVQKATSKTQFPGIPQSVREALESEMQL